MKSIRELKEAIKEDYDTLRQSTKHGLNYFMMRTDRQNVDVHERELNLLLSGFDAFVKKFLGLLDEQEKQLQDELANSNPNSELESRGEVIEAYMGNYDDVAFESANLAKRKLLEVILGVDEK